MSDLISCMNTFSDKIDKMASMEYIDKALQKLVSEDFVKTKLNDLKQDLTKEIRHEIKSKMDKVYERFKSVKIKIVEQATEIEDLKAATSDLQTEVERSKAENEKLAKANNDLREAVKQREMTHKSHEKELNEIEQYTRRNSVRIYGVADSERFEASSRTAELVASMINSKLELPVSTSDIDIAHRLGKFRADGNRPFLEKRMHQF